MDRNQHILYTRNELLFHDYYYNIIQILKNDKISSYIDIGSNIGEFCNVFFEKIPTLSRAFLIEPDVQNFNFMVNRIKNENIKFFNVAIGYNFKNPFLLEDVNNVGGFILIDDKSKTPNVIVKGLEELDLPFVDLIKIDVEGGEYGIIKESNILKKTKWIEIEFHKYWDIPSIEFCSENLPNHRIIEVDKNEIGVARILLKLK